MLPADQTMNIDSGGGHEEWTADAKVFQGTRAADECGYPTIVPSQTLELRETARDGVEKLEALLIKNEQEIMRKMGEESTEIKEYHWEPKSLSSEAQGVPEINRVLTRRRYSRSEMEDLRLVDVKDHREPESCSSEAQGVPEINGILTRRRYSRSEMEELSLVNVKDQHRMWKEVYQGLGSVVAQEYDGLRATNNQKKSRKKKGTALIMGKASAEATPTGLHLPNPSDHICAETSVCHEHGEVTEELSGECNVIDADHDVDSDGEQISIQRPAFLVEGEPDFESGPPLDGLEYLRRVRWEAAQIPKVKVAKLNLDKLRGEQTPYMPKIPEIIKCPPNLLPSKSWETTFLADFSEIRQSFSELESSGDQPPSSPTECGEQADCSTERPKRVPTMTTMLGMDSVSRAAELRSRIKTLEAASMLSRGDCLWLFALCAAVDVPIHADTCSALRCMLRKCFSLLAGKSEPDDEVAMLTILATIAGKYFGQSEDRD